MELLAAIRFWVAVKKPQRAHHVYYVYYEACL